MNIPDHAIIILICRNGESFVHVFDGEEAQQSPRNQGHRVRVRRSRFPREDASSPRMRITQKECPDEYANFQSCLSQNATNPEKCAPLRDELMACGKIGIKAANTDKNYQY